MTGTGKIARLPRAIREELNRRMADGQMGKELLPWLNGLPKVKALLAEQFAGRPISKQNLYDWRVGGYGVWQARQELLAEARAVAADAKGLASTTEGPVSDHLAAVLAVRYAAALAGWNGEVTEEFREKVRVLRSLCQDVAKLRQGDHNGARLGLAWERMERERKKAEERARRFRELLRAEPKPR